MCNKQIVMCETKDTLFKVESGGQKGALSYITTCHQSQAQLNRHNLHSQKEKALLLQQEGGRFFPLSGNSPTNKKSP